MAEKRMFAQRIVETDDFRDLSPKAQALYFHMGMQADDDGVVGNYRGIVLLCGCGRDELDELVRTGYIQALNDKAYVICHWHIHNNVPKKQYKPSMFRDQLNGLMDLDEDGIYRPRSYLR